MCKSLACCYMTADPPSAAESMQNHTFLIFVTLWLPRLVYEWQASKQQAEALH